jgi:hypothetical protein
MGRLSDKNASYFIPPVLTGARRNELVPPDNFQNQENRGGTLGRKGTITANCAANDSCGAAQVGLLNEGV